MGLTKQSVGIKTVDMGLKIKKLTPEDKVIALAGNPNVGKSTLFNNLTGLNQHTGNWSGKTVTNAQGYYKVGNKNLVFVDIPGTYSIMAHSAEEEVARDFICFGGADAIVVVCDATCLERNLNLVLQTIEVAKNVIVCVNLMDEAKRKGICINFEKLSKALGVPVVGTIAREKRSLQHLAAKIEAACKNQQGKTTFQVKYTDIIEEAISILEPAIAKKAGDKIKARWLSLKMLDYDEGLMKALKDYLGYDISSDSNIIDKLFTAKSLIYDNDITDTDLKDMIVASIVQRAEDICREVVTFENLGYNERDHKIDRILTSRLTGFPIMIALLAFVFWLTITGANYPSRLIASGLFWVEDKLTELFVYCQAPSWLHGMVVLGVYRVLAWVVSVMLPPMAIFFPLFTLLEDLGYLPRVAFNLDKYFKKCCACGKQALTMCMGFGCNAAGIIGCRIIDSPRERLIAMITNNFVPCNGRFPTLIAILSMFFVGSATGMLESVYSTLLLTLIILLGVFMTLVVSKVLSKTILKGIPSFFTLELPPYRRPEIGKVIVRSVFDRTLFVLGRAMTVAAPTGLVIWIMANIKVYDLSLLSHCAGFLDPLARLMGLDGTILFAFILGFPANEIVVPIIIMAYMSEGSILELSSLTELKALLVLNGWTWITAVSTMLFSLMHWPCSTTCLTIRKETGSLKWTIVSFLLPAIIGFLVCCTFAGLARLFV